MTTPDPIHTRYHPIHTRYLQHLLASPDDRAALVEVMRASASLLDGAHGSLSAASEPARTAVAHQLARQLREAAHQLCEHARTHGVRCRYCDTLVPAEGFYDGEGG